MLAIILLTCPFNAYAIDTDTPVGEEIIEDYVNVKSTSASISITGLTCICRANLKAYSSMSLSITMSLQKYSSGAYTNVKTWSSSKTGTSMSLEETRVINPLYDYRLKVTFKAGSETVTVYKYP